MARRAGATRTAPRSGRTGSPAAIPSETTRPALFTALRTGFAEALLREAFLAIRDLRADAAGSNAASLRGSRRRGLGKLLVVAPDQDAARRYLELVRSWIPREPGRTVAQIATSDSRRRARDPGGFRLRPEPSILVTVAMAYEGLDVPEVAVVAALTHIRSRPWLEQMVARATRVDPHAGPYETQRALVFHPDDPLFAQFRRPHGNRAGHPGPARRSRRHAQAPLPLWLLEPVAAEKDGIVPLRSQRAGVAVRHAAARSGPGDAPPGAGGRRNPNCWSRPRSRSGGCGRGWARWWRRRRWRTRRAAPGCAAASAGRPVSPLQCRR